MHRAGAYEGREVSFNGVYLKESGRLGGWKGKNASHRRSVVALQCDVSLGGP